MCPIPNIDAAVELSRRTGCTLLAALKYQEVPISGLATAKRITTRELQAAREFSATFENITRLYPDDRPDTEGDRERWRVYKEFANYWSVRRKRLRDPLLSVFVAAVVDQQPLEHIAQDNGLTVLQVERLIIKGLRDYARRAGWH